MLVRGRAAACAGAAVLVCLVALGLGQQLRSSAAERGVDRVADELQVPPAWSLVSATSSPDRLLCSGGCPSVRRHWSVPADVSTAAFTSTYERVGWPLRLEDDCEPATTGQLGRRSCVASGEVQGWPVQLQLRPSRTRPGTAELTLFVG